MSTEIVFENDFRNIPVFVFADDYILRMEGEVQFLQVHDEALETIEGEVGIIIPGYPEREIVWETYFIEFEKELSHALEIIFEIR